MKKCSDVKVSEVVGKNMKLFMKQTKQRNGPSAGKEKYAHILKQNL